VTTLQLDVPDGLMKRFDVLAAQVGHTREWLIVEAMETYLGQITIAESLLREGNVTLEHLVAAVEELRRELSLLHGDSSGGQPAVEKAEG
jgi:hypothetical protein